jgi:uncharacterized protein YukE
MGIMAQGGFSIQIDDFAAVAPKFTQAGDELTSATSEQTSTLDGLGAFWGTTAHGPEFGANYQPLAQKVLQLAKMAGVAVESVADGLTEMGKQYGVTETQITAALKDLQR